MTTCKSSKVLEDTVIFGTKQTVRKAEKERHGPVLEANSDPLSKDPVSCVRK